MNPLFSRFHNSLLFCLVLAGLLALAFPVRGALTITGIETGGGVVFTFVGSLDTTGAVADGLFSPETNLNPGVGTIESWQTTGDAVLLNLQSAVFFGADVDSFGAGAGSGDNFAIFGDDLSIEDTYVSGSPFAATLTFTTTDLATLGIDAVGGPYMWTLTGNDDTITMRFPQYETAPVIDNSALVAKLKRKIRKLKRKVRKAKQRGQRAKARKLKRKVRKLRRRLRAL